MSTYIEILLHQTFEDTNIFSISLGGPLSKCDPLIVKIPVAGGSNIVGHQTGLPRPFFSSILGTDQLSYYLEDYRCFLVWY